MHPLDPVINTFVRLLDVPADLQHLSREAQLQALRAPYARIRTLGGLARRAQQSALFMGEDWFWSDPEATEPSLHFAFDSESGAQEFVEWEILLSGELRLTCLMDLLIEGEEGDTTVTLRVTPSGETWTVEVVESCWPTTRAVARLQALLGQLQPGLSLSAEQLADLRPVRMAPVLEAFVHVIDVPRDLAHLSRDQQLEALRREYADVETVHALVERANCSARFMRCVGFDQAYDVDLFQEASEPWEHQFTFTAEVSSLGTAEWLITESGRLHLTWRGVGQTYLREGEAYLTVHVFQQDGAWKVGLEDWSYATMLMRTEINKVLKRFDPKLSLTPKQVAGVHFVGHRGAIPR